MSRSLSGFWMACVLLAGAALVSAQQPTRTDVVVNKDGTYTVIEYPLGREVTVNLLPGTVVAGSKGIARVMRTEDGTKVWFDISGVPATTTRYYAYAVDPAGVPTLLGPLNFENGVAKAEFSTPMNQFMLVLSPNEGLTMFDRTSTFVYHSEVPSGYAVVPKRMSENRTLAVSTVPAAYDVPLLNVPNFGDAEREIKLKFAGELDGLEAKAYIDREDGVTKVKMHFDDMKKVPANKRFTLWAASPDGKYTKLGQVVNSGQRDEARINTETAMTDFGLFITVEDSDVTTPTSRIYSVFRPGT
jgi:hypothetical protein